MVYSIVWSLRTDNMGTDIRENSASLKKLALHPHTHRNIKLLPQNYSGNLIQFATSQMSLFPKSLRLRGRHLKSSYAFG